MVLFHGSPYIIDKPEYGKGRPNNDYGRGFYCTEDKLLAKEWAVDENRDGYVNQYELDLDGLKVIDLNSEEYCVLHWITVLLNNRRFDLDTPLSREAYRYLSDNFMPELSGADVIRGYRADDSYFSFAQDFINGVISVSQLTGALKLGDLGQQVVLKSREAFKRIRYIGSEGVLSREWFPLKRKRDNLARREYFNMNRTGYVRGDLYMIRIIDEEVKPGDARLQ